MCIRDRNNGDPETTMDIMAHELAHHWWGDLVTLTTAYDMSVSYTHLRAHETVLDLVCRLLLEKKNPSLLNFISCSIAIHQTPRLITYLRYHTANTTMTRP